MTDGNGGRLLARAPGVVHTMLDGEAVLLKPSGGEVYSINAVGAAVWVRLAESPATLSELGDMVAARFEVDPRQARMDVNEFADSLLAEGLLETP